MITCTAGKSRSPSKRAVCSKFCFVHRVPSPAGGFSSHASLRLLEQSGDVESGCLYGEAYEALYDSFGEMELAVLCKIVFREALRGGTADLADIIRECEATEHEWQHHLIEYMERLDDRRIRTVDEWIGRIDYEDISFY